jgi:general secretion pathway protein A
MYEPFWGLREKPFENAPDPRFLFLSSEHRRVLDRLVEAARSRRGGALLTGEYGCGKTLLLEVLGDRLRDEGFRVAMIPHPARRADELLRELLAQLGIEPANGRSLAALAAESVRLNAENGVHTVLLLDEARAVAQPGMLDDLRLVLSARSDDVFLATVVLAGRPDLRDQIAALPQLDRRLEVKCRLDALDEANTAKYISYRLGVAGANRPFFTHDAVESIYRHSYGCPRRVNDIGDLALLLGYQNLANEISAHIVEAVA